jgi:hypothetical protein
MTISIRNLRLPGFAAVLFAGACSSSSSGSLDGSGDAGAEPNSRSDAAVHRGSDGDDAGGDANGYVPGDASALAEGGGDAAPGHGGGSDASTTVADAGLGAGGLAYMVGIKTNGVPAGPSTVQGWLDRPLDIAGTTITTTSYIGSNKEYVNASGNPPLLEVSFPLLSIFGESNGLNDLAKAAAGDYDATYEAMAQALAAWPNTLLSARIGWEFNGNWYAWSNGVGTNATYANYVKAFQHAAEAIRKYNPKALIQWCVAWGQPDPTPYWPGAYDASTNPGGVDVISMDFYQANISQYNNGGKTSTWAMAQTTATTIDLDWMVTYAKSKGVRIALSEYGAGSPSSKGEGSGAGLNDGTWTAASIAWINAQDPGFFLWTLWSDDAPADDIVTSGANPAEQGAWKTAWKGTHFAGSWWP